MLKIRTTDISMSLVLLLVLAVMFIPIPAPLLDLLLVVNIAVGILMMVYIISIKDPLEFSSFPTVLLMVTLMRLAVNVSTTRQILLNAFAGQVIDAFGQFVVGGNYLVGLVIFGIIVIINFKVITKGSGRIAEVAARFTLDSLPGKQMSIDADLNQGVIDEKEAISRREKLTKETDFYGAMDGASKFVSGDATAGLIITALNILAGFGVGMLQKGMTAGDALSRYTILTIGDGLVSQIPALVISTGAGILVTRAASDGDLGEDVGKQLFCHPRPLIMTGSMLMVAGLVPGLPLVPFFLAGALSAGGGYFLHTRTVAANAAQDEEQRRVPSGKLDAALPEQASGATPPPPKSTEPTVKAYKNVLSISAIELKIGFGLISLVDRQQGGHLVDRIGNIRNQIAEELGLVIPRVSVQDDISLKSNEYRIMLRGLDVARSMVMPGQFLAIDPSGELELEGLPATTDPSFGFRAYWVPANRRSSVESRGFTLVDPGGVVTTHLATIVRDNAADLLTRQDVNDLIDQVKENSPAVVNDLIPQKIELGTVHRILQELLKERVSIRDLTLVLETLSDHAGQTKDIGLLTELARNALGGTITQNHLSPDGTLKAIGLHPDLEQLLRESGSSVGSTTVLRMDPVPARDVLDMMGVALGQARDAGLEPVLLTSPPVRRLARQLAQCEFKDLAVLSLGEVPGWIDVDIINMIPAPAMQEQPAA